MDTLHLRPLTDRVIIARSIEVNKTPGGLHIPENAKEKPAEGTVVAVGPGKPLEDGFSCPTGLTVGDRVLFGKYSGTEVEVDGRKLLIMRGDDVFCVVGKDSRIG